MAGVELSIRSNVKDIQKRLSNFAYKQVDYATALALTTLAKRVAVAEAGQIKGTFAHPKPFTVNSVGVKGATKRTLTAIVYMRPVAAKYLQPYEEGGVHVLPGRALLNPKDIRLDQYGQLTRATLARLKARPDIFIGPVKTKKGIVNGVWQRSYVAPKQKVAGRGAPRGRNTTDKLKLLIRFGDALPVKKRLHWGDTAKKVIDRGFVQAFTDAMAKAMATAR